MSPRTRTAVDFAFFRSRRASRRQQQPVPAEVGREKAMKQREEREMAEEAEKRVQEVRTELAALEEQCLQQGLSERQLIEVFAPFVRLNKRMRLERLCVLLIATLLLTWTILYTPSVSWAVGAIGRVSLVKVLPYWDWRHLAEARCLIGQDRVDEERAASIGSERMLMEADCDVCELIRDIERENSTTSDFLEQNYFSRGAPVIVTDTEVPDERGSIIDSIFSNQPFLNTYPCDVYTNLQLPPFGTVQELFAKRTHTILNNIFLYIENCEKSAVKAARTLIRKPYFYSRHLPTPYVNWVLISDNYDGLFKALPVNGFSTFTQLNGRFEIILSPKEPCDEICLKLNTIVQKGETVAWSSMLWNFQIRAMAGEKAEAMLSSTDILL